MGDLESSSQTFGCLVATGKGTRMEYNEGKTCRDSPFRDVTHAIMAYALNQSSMYLKIPCPRSAPGEASFLEVMVPNEWSRRMGVAMGIGINALPRKAWEALQLHATQP